MAIEIRIFSGSNLLEDFSKYSWELSKRVKALSYSEYKIFALNLCIEEIFDNAFRHGNKKDTHKDIIVSYEITQEYVDVSVQDKGKGFYPDKIPDPTLEKRLEIPEGRGFF